MPEKEMNSINCNENKVENIFVVRSDELKHMMQKYTDIFSEAKPSYFKNKNEIDGGAKLSTIKSNFKKYFKEIDLESYNLKDTSKNELHLPYELADIYCLMAHVMGNKNNLVADGKQAKKHENAPENILKFVKYNEEVLNGIEQLPAQIKYYIEHQEGYIEQLAFSKRMYAISERFTVLLSYAYHSAQNMNYLIEKLDSFIDEFIFCSTQNNNENKPKTPATPIYFDKLLSNIFNEISKTTLKMQESRSVNIKEACETSLYEMIFVEAWKEYNKILEMPCSKDKKYYNMYEFISIFYKLLKKNNLSNFKAKLDMADLLNSIYANIDKYKELYKEEYIPEDDKTKIKKYLDILNNNFDNNEKKGEIVKETKKEQTAKEEIEKYKYKKFLRDFYLTSTEMEKNFIYEEENIEEETELENKRLFPYIFKQIITKDKKYIKEALLKKEFENKYSDDGTRSNIIAQMKIRLDKYRDFSKYCIFLLILSAFIEKICNSEKNIDEYIPTSKTVFLFLTKELKIDGIFCGYTSVKWRLTYYHGFLEKILDRRNISKWELRSRLSEMEYKPIKSGVFALYYDDLKKCADNIILKIPDFGDKKFEAYLDEIKNIIEKSAINFIKGVYVKNELSNSRKYYYYKNRSSLIEDELNSISGGVYRDNVMEEMNIE